LANYHPNYLSDAQDDEIRRKFNIIS
jgi:hypothetical protein